MRLDSLAEERERARREQQVDHVHVSDSVTREPMASHYSVALCESILSEQQRTAAQQP